MFHNHKLEALYLQRHLLDELIRKNKINNIVAASNWRKYQLQRNSLVFTVQTLSKHNTPRTI